jgi:hypothetical protein
MNEKSYQTMQIVEAFDVVDAAFSVPRKAS